MGKYKELEVWQQSMKIVTQVYEYTAEGRLSKDFGLKDQIQRSAVSIPSNIAEGEESLTNKMTIRHFSIAKASAAELITQLLIAKNIGYLKRNEVSELEKNIEHVAAILNKLIKYRRTL